jgi:hypothetical protein
MFAMDNLGYPMPADGLSAHLRYLEEKGYLVSREQKGEGYEVSFASLTAGGWDLLDGLREDGGVDTAL